MQKSGPEQSRIEQKKEGRTFGDRFGPITPETEQSFAEWLEESQPPSKSEIFFEYLKQFIKPAGVILFVLLVFSLAIKSCESVKTCDVSSGLECQYESMCQPLLFALFR